MNPARNHEEQPRARDLFLSHRATDKAFVRRLAADLAREQWKGRQLSVWVDEAEIRPGQSVTGMVNLGLEASRFIALVMTPAYFESESGWTDAEWHAALYRDPDNRLGRLLPLLAEDCPYVPILLRHLLFADFRGRGYRAGLQQLLRALREEPRPRLIAHRGQLIRPSTYIDRTTLVAERAAAAADPDPVEENLSCNLLPVDHMPAKVYMAPVAPRLRRARRDGGSSLPSKEELKQAIREEQERAGIERPSTPAFRLTEGRIVTFHDLESPESALTPVIDLREVEVADTANFLLDEDQRRLVVSLVNMGIERHLFRRGLRVDASRWGGSRYFFPPHEGSQRVVEWRPFRNIARRTVAKPYRVGDEIRFWLHQAAYIKPLFIAARFFLQITPTWLLTHDGSTIKGGPEVGRVVIRWTGRERNTSVLYHVCFWTQVLGQRRPGPISIRLGDQTMEVSPVPAYVHQPYGIEHDQRDIVAALDHEADLIARAEDAAEVEEDADEPAIETVAGEDRTSVEKEEDAS